jgi:K+-sensing histidine kinase KdpD
VTGKFKFSQPNEPNPPVKVHRGWKRSRKPPLNTAGAVSSFITVMRQTTRYMLPEDGRTLVWMAQQQGLAIEKATLEQKIEELTRKLERRRDAF